MGNIYIYQTSPNQKGIVTKKTKSDTEHNYGICNISATLTAAKRLTDRAFKLYYRMNLHQDGFAYALSPVEISHSVGLSDKKYREAVKELIEKGYLVQSAKRKNLYFFYENPDIDNNNSFILSAGDNAVIDDISVENGYMEQINGNTKAANRDREILHNFTSQLLNNTNNTVMTSKELDENIFPSFDIGDIDDLPF